MRKKIHKSRDTSHSWKEKSKEYLKELERFFDKAENIEDETLRNNIINQMLRCDKTLTEIAECKFTECYEEGKRTAKDE